jgi:cytochrome d ubiquinol oxidase subunit II
MTAFLASIGLPELIAGLMMLALNAYALTGGADFGGGLWDLLASGPRRVEQRELIGRAIAPIWEANHVWLIVVIVVLFTAFPSAFAALGTLLHLPLALLLIGIVLRGSAFVFRSYGSRQGADRRRFGRAFAMASTVTPILLGIIIGALASGDVGVAASRLGSASFTEVFIRPWLAPFPLAIGALALALFAFLAAVYLTLDTHDPALRNDFRRRALGAAIAVFVLAFGALALSWRAAPRVRTGLLATPWALWLQVVTAGAAITAIVALWRAAFRVARVAAAAQVSFILWGWALAQYPYLVPDTLTIRQAAAPRVTLELLLAALAAGALVLVPSLAYLFRMVRGLEASPAAVVLPQTPQRDTEDSSSSAGNEPG